MGVFDLFEGWIFIIIIAISVGGRIIRAINKKQESRGDQQPSGQDEKNLLQKMSGQNAYSSARVDKRTVNDGTVASRLAQLQAQLVSTLDIDETREKKERERKEKQRKERERKLAETNRERERFAYEQRQRLKKEEQKMQIEKTGARGARSVVFEESGDLVKGIVMSEILGPPRGRKTSSR